ncbi:SAM-dependent methyltransferase [Croceibacterium mercuriale]|uniref:Release factor glutamine methyltransferase n=1 Tax=Croceibacterium mercuriale TaxID=1572751 RepID=A0A0B2BTZ1_9SPHN|nr:peptide chain release factor N(5)-glutamine methyltransferase [Croceibacterium mercuriale]KHL24909.1 SAM-dependent methyltransferase [Croceibacterium mercuriale]
MSGVTVADALRTAAARLAATSDTARLDAELLMAHALHTTRSAVLLRHMADPVPAAFATLVDRRARHEPVAYILSQQEFYGRVFAVDPGVLIPRADSETIVEAALAVCPAPRRVLDLGTGSGALLLTVLAETGAPEGVGLERSADARRIASANAAVIAPQARIVAGDWHQPGWADTLGRFDLILANPPYVEDGADLAPDVRGWEPAAALFAGAEGLDDYRVLVPQLPALLAPSGVAVLEIGAAQGPAVTTLAEQAGFGVTLQRDLAGRARALVLQLTLGKGGASN